MAKKNAPPVAVAPAATGGSPAEVLLPLRQELDGIDRDLVRLIARRLETVRRIVAAKSTRTGGIRDAGREREVLARVEAEARTAGVSAPLVRRIFTDIIAHSVSMQATTLSGTGGSTAVRVALQGDHHSYDHLAAEQYLGGRGLSGEYLPCESLRATAARVLEGKADLAFLPIENTFAGSSNPVYDLLREHELHIVGEETFKIDHCLAAPAEVPLSALERVLSHAAVLEQCSAFLDGLPRARTVATRDTAEALRQVAEAKDPSQAAIAAPESAAAFGLVPLRHGIGNLDVIQSRFVALATTPLPVDPRVPCKISLILSTRHEHGALLRCLQILSDHGLSLTKLESRPARDRPWEYMFFIDFEGHLEAEPVRAALAELRAQALFLKILGCYPAKATPANPQASRLSAAPAHGTVASAPAPATPLGRLGAPSTRRARARDTVIRVADLLLGGDGFAVLAGPPELGDAAELDAAARAVQGAGAHVLCAGLLRGPDDPPARVAAHVRLAAAGKAHGIPVAAAVERTDEVRDAAARLDLLVVPARHMQDFALLRELARVDRPVVLERAPSATIDEWLAAADFVLAHGNGQVLLCERGIRTFESASRGVVDLGAVAAVRERCHLPILVDPGRGTGQREFIAPLALAARAAGAHGLVLSTASAPAPEDHAVLDGPAFASLLRALARLEVPPLGPAVEP